VRVPLLDLNAQNAPLRDEIVQAISRVVDGGTFILGSELEAFERELAAALGVGHAIGVSSGTDALLVTLMALGVGPGDEVVTTPLSFYATVGCIVRLGARPVFADIDPVSFNLDPGAAEAAVGPRTRAVIPVHLFGRPASLPRTAVPIVEDAAQSIGACPLRGIASCLSFFPSKNLGAFGDAGAVLCRTTDLADKILLRRTHGARPKYVHQVVGGNFRLDALQAAVLRAKLPHLPAWTQRRQANADRYRRLFSTVPGIPAELRLPEPAPGHIYNQFVIRTSRRDGLREYLSQRGVGTEVYYPVPLHLQPCFTDLGYQKGDFPHAEKATEEVLALPIYPELTEEQQEYVVRQIAAYFA
jgi:dTDP-4-amino-4,6-dideoxygalactose transaminase